MKTTQTENQYKQVSFKVEWVVQFRYKCGDDYWRHWSSWGSLRDAKKAKQKAQEHDSDEWRIIQRETTVKEKVVE